MALLGAMVRWPAGPVLATSLLAVAPATAAEIADPAHRVVVSYAGSLWRGALDGDTIDLHCLAEACGGAAAECLVDEYETKPGNTPQAYHEAFLWNFTSGVVEKLRTEGENAELVEKPTHYKVGASVAVLSSIRYNENTRIWYAQIDAPFGVLLFSCYGDEDKYEAAEPSWLNLVKDTIIPRE